MLYLVKRGNGFTLIELLIVCMIIGILAAIGFPQFGKTKEHALGQEAKANLKLIRAAERIYRMESATNTYVSCNCSSSAECSGATGCNTLLRLSLTTGSWNYSVAALGAGANFTAYADRQGTGGTNNYLDCQYSINQSQEEPVNTTAYCP